MLARSKAFATVRQRWAQRNRKLDFAENRFSGIALLKREAGG